MRLTRKLHLTIIILVSLFPTLNVQAAPPTIGGCQVFPADNPWNTDISGAAVHPNSANYINNINNNGGGTKVHPDFGGKIFYGIPYVLVNQSQPKVPVSFLYDDESDPGPYPIPPNAPIEGLPENPDGDRHVIAIDTDNCVLYEIYKSYYVGGASQAWQSESGAIYNLNSNAMRPDGWTSADAAGLPIFPGLTRCDEAVTGEINHALRFTVRRTQRAYIYPATHFASSLTDTNYPPMGLRMRIKASFSEAGFTGQSLAIVRALKKYGMILADNGSNWYISGESNASCWNDNNLNQLKGIVAANAFEVIVSPPPATVVYPHPSLYSPADGAEISVTQPILNWNPLVGAAKYQLRMDSNNPPTTLVATVNNTSLTQYIPLTPLTQGFPYYWQVRALNASNAPITDWSPIRSFIPASTAGAGPTIRMFTTLNPVLTWNPTSSATGYEIQVSNNMSFTGAPIIPLAASALSYTATVPQDGTYYWRVRALGGTGAWSAAETIIIHQ